MSQLTDFYKVPSPTSDLERHAALIRELPDQPEALSAIVRGLLIHNFTVSTTGMELPSDRMSQLKTVGAGAIVDNVLELDPAPLDVERQPERRMVGFCYHFALLHCGLLRAVGIPARTRCGFARYFQRQKWIDHWVVEHWQRGAWRLVDPQLGRDLTAEDFQNGATAWRRCRDGQAAPEAYGNGELWGWDELRGSLINDVAALAKIEIAGWYWCDAIAVEPIDRPHEDLDASLDALARRSATADSAQAVTDTYEAHPEFHPPKDAVAC